MPGAGAERMAEHVRALGVDGLDLRVGPRDAARHRRATRRGRDAAPRSTSHRHLARHARADRRRRRCPSGRARRAHEAFRLLAEAEARMHDSEPELVHFHEVGGLDALADVCGVALALEELGIDRVECSPHPVLARLRRGLARPAAAAGAGDARAAARRAARAARARRRARHARPAPRCFAATVERYGADPADDARGASATAPARATCRRCRTSCASLVGELSEPRRAAARSS